MFFNISQFLMEFQLQFIGPSERAFQDAFFEYSNLYFTFWKVWVMTQNILQDFFWKWPFYTANMIFETFEIFYHPNGLRLCRRHRFQVFSSLYHILGGSTTVFLGQNQCFCLFEAPKIQVLKPFWTSRTHFFHQ